MSLIRKHVAVLQAWACLDLVSLAAVSALVSLAHLVQANFCCKLLLIFLWNT